MTVGFASTGILCPHCGGHDQQVKDSRPSSDMIRRRRLCKTCGLRFTTFESFAVEAPFLRTLRQHGGLTRLTYRQEQLLLMLVDLFVGAALEKSRENSAP